MSSRRNCALLALILAGCDRSTAAGANPSDASADAPANPAHPPPVPVAPAFVGSGGFGYAFGSSFVGAAAPHGMVKLGPDTKGPWGTINFLHYSGYWYGDDTIIAFSHMHLHGTGATDYGVLGVMPVSSFDVSKTTDAGHTSKFAKADESCDPGHYTVKLADGGIVADLTATPHAAHHRYTFGKGATSGHVVFDLDHHLNSGTIRDAEVKLTAVDSRVTGRLHSVGGMSSGFGGYDVYFDGFANKAWRSAQVWHDGTAPAEGVDGSGAKVGFVLDFDTTDGAPIELRIGLSLVSAAGATANLAAEIPAFDFPATLKKTTDDWSSRFARITVKDPSANERIMLTAAMYHAFLMPSWVGDADGSFIGMDGTLQHATDFHYFSDMSLWDTYRTLHPFYSLIAPESARDSVKSLLAMAAIRGNFPRWPIATGEAGTMIGDSAEIVIADAYLKGITDFDTSGAWAVLNKVAVDPSTPSAQRGSRDDFADYIKSGYLPASHGGSVSRTLEDARADYALGKLAFALGKTDTAAMLNKRSQGWRALFDSATHRLWARGADGSWPTSHADETAFQSEFVEGDSAQWSWSAMHDVEGYISLYGSRKAMIDDLESFFEQGKADYDALNPADLISSSAPRPYYWAGNEPDIHAVYLFALAGRPDLTQKWLPWILAERFGPGADGIPGNDDGGTMSTYWLFGAIGLYPVVGDDRYVVSAPLFSHVDLKVAGGTFSIDAPGVSDANRYVQSATLNGAPLLVATIRHADLKAGGSLKLVMGAAPSAWAIVRD